MFNFKIGIVTFFLLATTAFSQKVVDIDSASDYYEPDDVTVAPGDVIRWTWIEGLHDVVSGAECESDGLYFDSGTMNSNNPIFEWTVPSIPSGTVIDYFCSKFNHCAGGMYGVVRVESVPEVCQGDVNGDQLVNVADLLGLISDYGCSVKCGSSDISGDGVVNVIDILQLISLFGNECE